MSQTDEDAEELVGAADLVKAIDRVSIEGLDGLETDSDFVRLSVDLLIEAASVVCMAASARPAAGHFDRDQAIVVGHVVRLYKLLHGLLDQTCQRRGEIAFIFLRLCFETIVDIRYLVSYGSPEVFRSYLLFSLRHERKLWDEIQKNIAERADEVLPIESRMMDSIRRSVEAVGVSIDEVSPSHPKGWGAGSLFDRARKVGLGDAYLAAVGGGSHSVHGNWQDLIDNHLTRAGGGFLGEPRWSKPRPQYLLAIASLTVQTLYELFEASDPSEAKVLSRISDLNARIIEVDRAHERLLTARVRAATEDVVGRSKE